MKIVIATVETEPARKEVIGSETRNSRFRENVAVPIQEITRLVHKELPWLSPTHLNIMGALEVTLGAIVAASREPNKPGGEKRKTAIAASLIFIGSIKDAFDGSLARMMAAENPKSVNFKKGAIYDVISDKTQEFSLAISRAFSATKRGSDIGALAALATAVTNPWPSISRAFSESLGKAVPESGKGVIGLIGTRPGRAVIGGVATLYPNPKGLPLQLAADVVMTGSNVITTFDRLRTAFGPGKVTRSSETMADAKTRLKVLGVVGAVTLGTSLFTLWRLNRRHKQERSEGLQAVDLMQVLNKVEQYCLNNGLDHRFVGGGLTDFIGPQTELKIDAHRKKAALINTNDPASVRSDGTVKDIDMVVFTPDHSKVLRARRTFARWSTEAETQGLILPKISMEAARHPGWPKRNLLKQFVTAWEIDQQNIPHLVFGALDQALNPASIEPWTVDLGNGTKITTFNPVAHALCYALRVPSGIKRKDREKIGEDANGQPYSRIGLVNGLGYEATKLGFLQGVDYNDMYKEWACYIEALRKRPDPLTRVKGMVTGFYWDTIGTQVAHGSGIFAGLSKFGDRMSG